MSIIDCLRFPYNEIVESLEFQLYMLFIKRRPNYFVFLTYRLYSRGLSIY